MRLALLLLLLLSACVGCGAPLRLRAHYMELESPTKEAATDWPTKEAALRANFEARREGPLDAAANDVVLMLEQYPKGISRIRNHLHVPPDSGYDLIAGYDLYASGATTLWFADYASGWRKAYCYPQVPLTWVTLGLWQLVNPVSWPCLKTARLKQADAWNQVRHLAAASDADVAIVELKMNGEDVVVAWGWLLRRQREK